jgi:hypothetical protein
MPHFVYGLFFAETTKPTLNAEGFEARSTLGSAGVGFDAVV